MVEYNCCKIEDIKKGDEIYFDDVYHGKHLTQSNFGEYWAVHGIIGDMVLVHFREYYWSVNIKHVRMHLSIPSSPVI